MDIELDDVLVERDGRRVLDIPSLRVRGGTTTAILGPNGAGKTTLLRVIAGLEATSSGRIRWGGLPHAAAIGASRVGFPQHVAYVFQEDVFLRRSVRANLELGLRFRGVETVERRGRVEETAGLLGIRHLLDRRADHLSGGEGRRVSLARALCLRAPLLLLDEPLAGLDARAYSHLLDELPQLLARSEATTLVVTHDRHEALRLAQDVVVLVGGRVHAAGGKRDVATNPRVREVAEVFGYSVLIAGGRAVAVPPGALKPGAGRLEFSVTVEQIVDLVERREVVGHVGGVRVHVAWPADCEPPAHGDRVVVHAERSCELD